MTVHDLEIVFNPLPGESLTRFIAESLGSYVVGATGQADWYPLGFFLRDGDGEWLGGLLGSLWGGWLHVTHLWVAPHRPPPRQRHSAVAGGRAVCCRTRLPRLSLGHAQR